VELFLADEDPRGGLSQNEVANFFADFHGLKAVDILNDLFERTGEDAIRHLFSVAGSLDSMVVGEPQILSQVKRAYELAINGRSDGPLTHAAFQAAIRVAKRVANETMIQRRRVSVASVAVADFARQIFERFDDKRVLVIGAGDMAEETLRYLVDEGARDITIVNRNVERGNKLAEAFKGRVEPFDRRFELFVDADLVISTTGAEEPIITRENYAAVQHRRNQRPLFILDLAVPRDIEPEVGEFIGVYLYSIDDLQRACESNRRAREKEWPTAEKIINEETARFMADLNHRATGPTIKRLKATANDLKDKELARLFNKLDELDEKSREEIGQSFERLINKLLHPPLESLRDEAESGAPLGLLEALKKLFQIKD
jgi:glutamyl-tRNA reductase